MSEDSSRDINEIFKRADYIPNQNTKVTDDISVLTNLLMEKFTKATSQSLMSHAKLKYGDIRMDNNGACLNYNLLVICSDSNCSYRQTKANTSGERIKAVKIKL